MDTPIEYAVVQATVGIAEINNLLKQGWLIITAEFCLHEQSSPVSSTPRIIQHVPYALMGLPKSRVSETTWAGPAMATLNEVAQTSVLEPATPAAAPDPSTQPIGSRPRPVNPLAASNDINRSEEVTVGVRRR